MLDRVFKLSKLGTDVKTEVTAGITVFMTMAYIIFVNPAILSAAGVPIEGAAVATCLGAGLVTFLMGTITNYPLALAPGMGINAIVAFTIAGAMGYSWKVAMGVIFIEGVIVLLLSLSKLRGLVMEAIPIPLKHAIGVGIGLFIAFIGLVEGGIVVKNPATLVSLGDLSSKDTLLTCVGLVITIVLISRRVKGAILIGIIATALLGMSPLFSLIPLPEKVFSFPRDFSTFFALDIKGAFTVALAPMIFALFMTDFFDTMGTAIGIGEKAGFLDERGTIPKLRDLLVIDSLGAVTGGLFGCSSITCYIESASGVTEGGRSGLSVTVTALLFFLSLFLTPLISIIGGGVKLPGGVVRYPVTAPALILVGFFMVSLVQKINFTEVDTGIPAFLTIIMMPLTYNISYGIGFGFISYTLIKILKGRFREVHPVMALSSLFFAVAFLLQG
ncbi:MAG: NCS2 family permease [Deltaproteobacteria bacterium]|nr:MAG: NCS2 family permease [Deltaproteobacteria bacterium]